MEEKRILPPYYFLAVGYQMKHRFSYLIYEVKAEKCCSPEEKKKEKKETETCVIN